MTFQAKKQGCKKCPWSCLSPSVLPTGQWCLVWWCFGGAGQLAVMTWCCPPSSFFYCTASGESVFLPLYGFVFVLHVYFIFLFIGVSGIHTQVGSSICGSVRPPIWLRPVLFCNAGGPWPRVPGHPGQLPYLWERHHVVEHERQHSLYSAQGSCAVCHLYTTR